MNLSLSFQPDLLGVMSQFSQFKATLDKYMATATEKSAGLIGTGMQGYMDFQHPSGVLEESIEVQMVSEYMAYIGSPVVYAHRREWSFKGPDSLGRMFPTDPATHYARKTTKDGGILLQVAQNYIEAVYGAWQECIGRLPSGTVAFLGGEPA